jgi:hypothetical protein
MYMQVISKSGLKVTLTISGTQEAPIIVLEPIPGKPTVKGPCRIAASQKRTVPGVPSKADSLYVEAAKGFLQMDLAPVYEAIAALPKKVYMSRRTEDIIDCDGDRCPVHAWKIEGSRTTKNGYYIQDSILGDFLDREGITEIETAKAVELWSAKYETPEKLAARKAANERGSRVAQHFADMEEMENGHPLSEIRDPTPEYPREG